MYQQKKITIISDTSMFQNEDGLFAFGPVVRELEYIENLFDDITWIGYERSDKKEDLSMQKIESKKIKLITLKNVGGSGLLSFLKIILQYPVMFWVIVKQIRQSNIIHTRAPSHPALIAILISFFIRKDKIWWNKYAGDWGQIDTPLSYRFQRKILKVASFSKVTINGFWPNQQKHCFSFENPCLTETDINKGKDIARDKVFSPPFTFSFVGRFDDIKGVSLLLNALKSIPINQINKIHLIGDGPRINEYKIQAKELGDKVIFHGPLKKENLHHFISQSHFFLLPSKAEGFPKVVAEAACYGVIPIVSNVGSIKHYLNHKNGFIWNIKSDKISYTSVFNNAIVKEKNELKMISNEVLNLAEQFTFENYLRKLKLYVLVSNGNN